MGKKWPICTPMGKLVFYNEVAQDLHVIGEFHLESEESVSPGRDLIR